MSLVHSHATVLFSPAVVGDITDSNLLAGDSDVVPLDLPPIVVPDLMLVPLSLLPPVREVDNASHYVDVYDYIPSSSAQSIF